MAFLMIAFASQDVYAQCEARASVNGSLFEDTTKCGPIQINFSDSLSRGVSSRIWDFGDGSPTLSTNNPSHIYEAVFNDTTYTGVLTIACTNGQTRRDSFEVTILGSPRADFSINNDEICAITDTLRLRNTSETGANLFYRWDFEDGSLPSFNQSTSDTSVIYNLGGDYEVELVAIDSANGCRTVISEDITVNPTPNPQFVLLNGALGCEPYRLQINNTTPQNNVQIASWEWIWGDGDTSTVEEPGNHVYDTTGSFTIRLSAATSSTQCTNFSTQEVTINPKPDPSFETNATADNPICPGDTVRLYFTGDAKGKTPQFTWQLGNFQDSVQYRPDSIGVVFGGSQEERFVSLTVQIANCDSTQEDTVFLFPLPEVRLREENGQDTICANDTLNFTGSPVAQDRYIFLLNGDTVADGNTNTLRLDTLTQSSQLVMVVASGPNNCSGRDTADIFVRPTPSPLLTRLTPGDTVCEDSEVRLQALPDNLSRYTFFERFNPLASGSADIVRFTVDDDSAVVLVEAEDRFGCLGRSQPLIIPIAEKTPAPQVNCGATDSNNIEFIWNQAPGATSYEISVDGGPFQTPSSGPTGTSHQISGLTLGDDATLRVRALGNPYCGPSEISLARTCETTPVPCNAITYDIPADTTLCAGDSAAFKIENVSTNNFTVNWAETGFSAFDTVFSAAFTRDTNLTIAVADSNQDPVCPAAFRFVDIEVPGAVLNDFVSRNTLNDSVCRETPIGLIAFPQSLDEYTFSTGGTVVQQSGNPRLNVDTLTQSRMFFVRGRVDNCPAPEDSLQITIATNPTVSLQTASGRNTVCPGEDVVVEALPDNLAEYSFFQNGFLEQQGAQDALVVSNPTSDFDIQASATSRYGCPSENFAQLALDVRERPEVQLTSNLPNDSLCAGDTARLQASGAFANYTFTNEGQTVAQQDTAVLPVTDPANGPRFRVRVTDDFGCESALSNAVLVRRIERPQPSVTRSADSICVGSEVLLQSTVQNPDLPALSYRWTNGATTNDQTLTPTTSVALGLVVSNFQCASDTVFTSIFVDEAGTPNLQVNIPDSVCVDQNATLSVSGAQTYRWRLINRSGDASNFLSATDVAEPGFSAGLQDTPFVDFEILGRNTVCAATTSVRVILDRCLETLPDDAIPQIITPNGDGVNDTWFIDAITYDAFRNNRVQILNRWGQEVFSAAPYRNDWDGVNNDGNTLADGTYYYVLDLGNGSIRKGFVIINR